MNPPQAAPRVRSTHHRRGAQVIVVDDGTPGGIRRAVEYLVAEWEHQAVGERVERLQLRGDGNLWSSAPVFASAVARTAARLLWRRPRLMHLNITQRGSTARA